MNLQTRLISPYAFAGMKYNQRKKYEMSDIVMVVARHTGKTFEQMKERNRNQYLVEARALCYLFIRKLMPYTNFGLIAEHFGGFDRTTIMHSVIAVQDKMAFDERLSNLYNKIEMELQAGNIIDKLKSLKIN